MQVIEIAFQHIEPSSSIEEEIRGKVAKLERLYDRITSCRVRINRPARNARDTLPPVVHIEMGIPGGKDLIVSHEPERLQRRYQTPDIRNAINDAFAIAERQLLDLKNQRTRRTKQMHHDDENQFLGQVTELEPEADHGFILTKEGGLLYFHRNSVLNGGFDKLRDGDEVLYVEDIGDTGPIATKLRARNHKS